jgi:hypothetical protein
MGAEHDQFLQSLESAGLDEVRARLAVDAYGDASNRRGIAKEWVLRKKQALEAEAQRARDALQLKEVANLGLNFLALLMAGISILLRSASCPGTPVRFGLATAVGRHT